MATVVALLCAMPVQRERDCDVCPVDCPMHAAARGAKPVGCHQGGADAPPRLVPADDGACAMRASCGHHDGVVVVALHQELPSALVVDPPAPRPHAVRATADPLVADTPTPRARPPKLSVV